MIVEGLNEELNGVWTQVELEPKTDNVGELAEKIDGMKPEVQSTTSGHIAAARDHCCEFVKEIPTF